MAKYSRRKTYHKGKGAMTLAQSLSCAVKIANGAPCTAGEMASALRTIGWAKKKGVSWFRKN